MTTTRRTTFPAIAGVLTAGCLGDGTGNGTTPSRADGETSSTPEVAGGGFLASSRIEIGYTKVGDDGPTTRPYTANYYVSPGPVYRAETDTDAVDARTRSDRQLVQCGTDPKDPPPERPTGDRPSPGGKVINAIEYIVRNDDNQAHELEFTIATPEGAVVHRRTVHHMTGTRLDTTTADPLPERGER